MTETPTPLDLDGVGWYEVTRWLVRADDAEAKVERQRDRLRARDRQVRRLRAEVTRLHALVADLRATASPAWDEEAAAKRAFTAAANAVANDETWAKASDRTKGWWRMIVQAVVRGHLQ